MLDEPSHVDPVKRRRVELAFAGVFAVAVLVVVLVALGVVPSGSKRPVSGVRAADDTLVEKSRDPVRRLPHEGGRTLADAVRVGALAEGPAQGAREVPRKATPVTETELAEILVDSHKEVFGKRPTILRVGVAWAHLALEHQRGAAVECHNFGNVSVPESAEVPFYARALPERQRKDSKSALGEWRTVTMRFRAYPSRKAGIEAYWRLLEQRYGSALQAFDVGNAHHAGRRLGELGYATAYPQPYALSMSDLHGEFRTRLLPQLGHLDVETEFHGKLPTPGAE